MQLMPFQAQAVAAIAKQLACSASVLLQSATGSGKTCIGLSYVAQCVAENPRFNTLVIVPSQALVDQMFLTCLALGLRVSVLHDTITRSSQGHKFSYDRRANVLISMPETFMNTVNGVNNLQFDKRWVANLLLQDEAHKNTSAESQAVRDYFPGVKVLGLSATPRREQNADGEHLFDWYDDRMITTVGINELVEMGRLARPEYQVYKPTDHVVSRWLSATEGHSNRSTIMFVKETSDALAYMASFKEHGITAEIVTGGSIVHNVTCQTPLQRQAIFSRFDSGNTEVLITVNALCEGFDSPRAHFCILMRNVVAEALYHQMVGRVLRAYPGKLEGVVMDFFNNVKQFGRVEDKRWSVMDYAPRSIQHVPGERISTKQFAAKTRMMFTCTDCAHVFDVKQNKRCTHCDAPAVVDLFEPVNEMFERLFKKIFKSDDELRSFCSTLRGFANTKHGDIMYNQLRAAKNKAFGIELFQVEGGFNPQYKHVEQVVNDSAVRRKQEIAMAA